MHLCVCYQASRNIPVLYIGNKVPLRFPWHFQNMHCVAFVENAMYKRSDNIWCPPLPFFASYQADGDRDSFISRILVRVHLGFLSIGGGGEQM